MTEIMRKILEQVRYDNWSHVESLIENLRDTELSAAIEELHKVPGDRVSKVRDLLTDEVNRRIETGEVHL